MKEEYIRHIINKVRTEEMSEEEAFAALKELPYKDLGFANLDNHRQIRTGFPEVVFCEGKTSQQVRDIFAELSRHGTVMGTRANREDFEFVKRALPQACYHETARIIEVKQEAEHYSEHRREGDCTVKRSGRIAVVSAGTADMPVAEEAAVTAEILGNEVDRIFDVGVAGIHRLLDKLDLISAADVVIVVAGMEGALASVVGGLVSDPVIAVPTSIGYGSNFEGLSALLSMLNSCANGVAVVNIDNGFGAGYMASVICRTRK
ncbi:MAG: nickel pincer cofactor biosynthesis protein LarB [Eubacteriales bacterium]|nr:nickel pincer cofactor biosynthesis protein LarB [Eubacteriales bacterium]